MINKGESNPFRPPITSTAFSAWFDNGEHVDTDVLVGADGGLPKFVVRTSQVWKSLIQKREYSMIFNPHIELFVVHLEIRFRVLGGQILQRRIVLSF